MGYEEKRVQCSLSTLDIPSNVRKNDFISRVGMTLKLENHNIYWLNLLRGLAALLVCSGHLRSLLFFEYSSLVQNKIGKTFYFLTGFGHQSVVIFFALSGFFITKSIDNSITKNLWSFPNYLTDRLTRLWVVLLPALFITLICDQLGLFYFPNSPTYLGQLSALPDLNPTGKSDVWVFLGNTFFLQGILSPTFGTNGPLWSLSYEFWYYLIFPLLLFTFRNEYPLTRRIIFFLLAILVMIFVGKIIMLYFLIWLMGGLAFLLYKKKEKQHYLIAILWVFSFITVLIATRIGIYPLFLNDFSLGFCAAGMIYSLAKYPMKNSLLIKISEFLSKISYTLYAAHLPICILLCNFLFDSRLVWTFSNLTIYFFVLGTILCIIFIIWFLFEKRTSSIKNRIKTALYIH